MTAASTKSNRIASIDQLRGYAILGMFLVDYFEHFDVVTEQLKHHREYMTYADTIAPLFMFVVGMGMRLSYLRRAQQTSNGEAKRGLAKRYLLLLLIAFTIYTGYLWDALMNIALASLVALLLVDKRPVWRIGGGLLILLVYQAIFSFTTYGGWLLKTVNYTDETMPLIWNLIPIGPELIDVAINGGPLGHWSWLMMLICGTVAYDIMATRDTRNIVLGCVGLGIAFALAGWALKFQWGASPEAGFFKPEWPFSKYHMTAPYALWSSGLCFFTMLLFFVVCDVLNVRLPHLTVLGMNPLFIYILQWCIFESAHRFIPEDTTNWFGIMAGFALVYAVCYGIAYYLYRKNIFIKL